VKYNEFYVPALLKEIEDVKLEDNGTQDYIVKTIFIGGGTPSILDGNDIADILNRVYKRYEIDNDVEITIEANPGTITKEKLEAYKSAGINRISMGLQTTNNGELQELGRIHTYEDFLENYKLAREIGFTNINIDLMSAIPGQTVESWNKVLENIIILSPEHISAYSLIIEEGTKFYVKYSNDITNLPSEDDEREMYYNTKKFLKAAGYNRYEISNYSKNGYECRHNNGYWQRVNYIGFGLGASSFINNTRFSNVKDMTEYLKSVENDLSNLHQEVHELSLNESMEEFMFLGLRMISGVSISHFEDIFKAEFRKIYGKCVEKLVDQQLLEIDNDRLYLTEKGLDLSNYVMSEFIL
jgi:oxygen-independent coproporphyrinogen-3 oxidase